jgi:hypothetical protein
MTVLRSAAFGCALALGAAGAHAQSVISRQIDNEPVETIVTQTPGGTVITRRPVAVAPAVPTYVDETVGAAPTVETITVRQPAERRATARTTTRTSRVVHRARSARDTRTARRATRRIASQPLVLGPAQRQVVYRTIVQQQVIPVAPSGYPPFPPPAYGPRTVVIAPSATTGYALTPPAADIDDVDVEQIPPAVPIYRPAYRSRYTIGAVLPADVVLTPLPATAAMRVPSVQPYSYATVDGRVLLVDPVTNAVVADITP